MSETALVFSLVVLAAMLETKSQMSQMNWLISNANQSITPLNTCVSSLQHGRRNYKCKHCIDQLKWPQIIEFHTIFVHNYSSVDFIWIFFDMLAVSLKKETFF